MSSCVSQKGWKLESFVLVVGMFVASLSKLSKVGQHFKIGCSIKLTFGVMYHSQPFE